MTRKALPCPTIVRLLLDCDYDTGKLTWRTRPVWTFRDGGKSALHTSKVWNGRYAGKEAFTATSNGYKVGAIFNVNIEAHRIVYCHYHGAWPSGQIDHENGITSSNGILNLRDITHAENTKNKSMTTRNKSGVMGVHWCKKDRRWVAQISVKNKSKHLGQFREMEDAIAARKAAERALGFHENHGRPIM